MPKLFGAREGAYYDRVMTLPLRRKSHFFWRLLVEVGSIVFLFYSNLLMGEFSRTNRDGKTLAMAIRDIFTAQNFAIALVSASIGYVVFEFWRKRLI